MVKNIFLVLFILIFVCLSGFLLWKRSNLFSALDVLMGTKVTISPNDKQTLKDEITELNEKVTQLTLEKDKAVVDSKNLDGKWETVDVVGFTSEGTMASAWKLEKPIDSVVRKNMRPWITGKIEDISIVGKDFEFFIYNVYENQSMVFSSKDIKEVVVNPSLKIYQFGDKIVKACEKDYCNYGYLLGKETFCGQENVLKSGEVCISGYIGFANSLKEHIANGDFECSGKDFENACDRIFKSIRAYKRN